MQMILVEGPDGAGKTQFATALADELGYEYHHNGVPPHTDATNIFWWQLNNLIRDRSTVIDRSWPSDQIYGRFFSRPYVFDSIAARMFERYMLSVSGIIIKCLPPYSTCHANWSARHAEGKELLLNDADLYDIYCQYAKWQSESLTVWHQDYTHHEAACWTTPPFLTESASSYALSHINPYPGVLFGKPDAPVLVVANEFLETIESRPLPESARIPHVSPWKADRELTHALALAGLLEADLKWVDIHAAPVPDPFIEDSSTRVIIALGAEAFGWATYNTTKPTVLCPRVVPGIIRGNYWQLQESAKLIQEYINV